MRRGRYHKRINITVDKPTWDLLEDKRARWPDFNASSFIRKAIKAYEKGKTRAHNPDDWDGIDVTPEDY